MINTISLKKDNTVQRNSGVTTIIKKDNGEVWQYLEKAYPDEPFPLYDAKVLELRNNGIDIGNDGTYISSPYKFFLSGYGVNFYYYVRQGKLLPATTVNREIILTKFKNYKQYEDAKGNILGASSLSHIKYCASGMIEIINYADSTNYLEKRASSDRWQFYIDELAAFHAVHYFTMRHGDEFLKVFITTQKDLMPGSVLECYDNATLSMLDSSQSLDGIASISNYKYYTLTSFWLDSEAIPCEIAESFSVTTGIDIDLDNQVLSDPKPYFLAGGPKYPKAEF
jgi:hypothetical protein